MIKQTEQQRANTLDALNNMWPSVPEASSSNAGFRHCGLYAMQLLPEDMPKPARPRDDNHGQASL